MMRIKKKKKTNTNKKEKADFAKQTYAVKTIQFVYVCVSACVLQLPKKPTGRKVTSQKPPLPFTLIS